MVAGNRVFHQEVGDKLQKGDEGSGEGCGTWDVCKDSFPRHLQVYGG